jgi:ABC-type uncharacterized transport system substrate-binding protein
MKRRELLLLIGGAFAAATASAQPSQHRIGFLRLATDAEQDANFLHGLQEAGYVEGRNLFIEYRSADGDYGRLPELAADLVRRDIEVIIASGGPDTARAAMHATTRIPIVGTSVAPLVKHFNRPEGNVTGVSILTGDLMPKRLQILAELKPGATIGVLMNPAYARYRADRKKIEETAEALSLKLAIATVSDDTDLDPAFATLAQKGVGAILTEAEPFLGNRWQRLVPLAARHGIPMLQEWREAVLAGGLISYAPSLEWIEHQVGSYAAQILSGAKPAELPVIAPTKIELVINMKTAKTLNLTVPQALLARADEVIE